MSDTQQHSPPKEVKGPQQSSTCTEMPISPQYKPLDEGSPITAHHVGNEEADIELDSVRVKGDGLQQAPTGSFHDREPLTTKQILYIVVMQGLGSFALNFGINALVAWLIYRSIDRIPLAGSITCIISF